MSLQLDPARRKIVSEVRSSEARQRLHVHYTNQQKHQYATPEIAPPGVLLWRAEGTPAEAQQRRDTSLLHAVRRGDLNLVKELLELGPIGIVPDRHRTKANYLLNARDFQGNTALHWASENGLLDIALTLLDAGADPVAEDTRKVTPLHIAAKRGFLDLTRLLVERGGNPAALDVSGHSPLEWSRLGQHSKNLMRGLPAVQVRPDDAYAHFFENRRRAFRQDTIVLQTEDNVFAQYRKDGAWWPAQVSEIRDEGSTIDVEFKDPAVTMFLVDDAPEILEATRKQEEADRQWKLEHGLDEEAEAGIDFGS